MSMDIFDKEALLNFYESMDEPYYEARKSQELSHAKNSAQRSADMDAYGDAALKEAFKKNKNKFLKQKKIEEVRAQANKQFGLDEINKFLGASPAELAKYDSVTIGQMIKRMVNSGGAFSADDIHKARIAGKYVKSLENDRVAANASDPRKDALREKLKQKKEQLKTNGPSAKALNTVNINRRDSLNKQVESLQKNGKNKNFIIGATAAVAVAAIGATGVALAQLKKIKSKSVETIKLERELENLRAELKQLQAEEHKGIIAPKMAEIKAKAIAKKAEAIQKKIESAAAKASVEESFFEYDNYLDNKLAIYEAALDGDITEEEKIYLLESIDDSFAYGSDEFDEFDESYDDYDEFDESYDDDFNDLF